jgi:hypothetical protein
MEQSKEITKKEVKEDDKLILASKKMKEIRKKKKSRGNIHYIKKGFEKKGGRRSNKELKLILNSMIEGIDEKVVQTAANLSSSFKKTKIIGKKEFSTAVKIVLPAELYKKFKEKSRESIKKYQDIV